MEIVKNVIVCNVLGAAVVVFAAFAIVGGSMVICGACTVGLLLAGG